MSIPLPTEPRTITIVGGGAVGGTLAVHLALADIPVRIVDADADHLAAIELAGLVVRTEIGELRARIPTCSPEECPDDLDTVILAVRTEDLDDALDSIEPHLAEDATVVTLQPGMGTEEIAARLGAHRLLPAHLDLQAERTGAGIIVGGGRTQISLPQGSGLPAGQITALACDLASCGPVRLIDDLPGLHWSQIVLETVLATVSLGGTAPARALEEHGAVITELIAELAQIAAYEGIGPADLPVLSPHAVATGEPDALLGLIAWAEADPSRRLPAWRDLALHRRRPEIVAVLRPVLQRADDHGICVPMLRALVRTLGDAAEGRAGISPGLLRALDGLAGSITEAPVPS